MELLNFWGQISIWRPKDAQFVQTHQSDVYDNFKEILFCSKMNIQTKNYIFITKSLVWTKKYYLAPNFFVKGTIFE